MEDWKLETRRMLESRWDAAMAAEQRMSNNVEDVKKENAKRLAQARANHCRARKARTGLEAILAKLGEGMKAADAAIIVERTRQLLTQNPAGIPVDELKPLVQDSLRDDGLTLIGTFRHWTRWIDEMQDVRVEDGRYLMVVHQE